MSSGKTAACEGSLRWAGTLPFTQLAHTPWLHVCPCLLSCAQSLLLTADVVPVTLELSDEELMFTFSLDNWDDHVEQVSTASHCPLQARTAHLCDTC
jgi:hypothetical protein